MPVFFLSLSLSIFPSACFSVTRRTHTQQMGRTGLFSPVYRHTGITLNCPVTFQKFSCHMEPSQELKDADYVCVSINAHFKMPPRIIYEICCISWMQLSLRLFIFTFCPFDWQFNFSARFREQINAELQLEMTRLLKYWLQGQKLIALCTSHGPSGVFESMAVQGVWLKLWGWTPHSWPGPVRFCLLLHL